MPMKTTILACCAAVSQIASPARADMITDWTARADELTAAAELRPPQQARALAMLHVSMFDAVNAVERRYAPFGAALATDRNTSQDAAAAAAGHAVLVSLFPRARAPLDELLAGQLRAIAEGPAKQRGVRVGQRAAAGLLSLRADDGSGAPETWRPTTSPGVYIPTTLPVGVAVRGYKPWAMTGAAQFRPAPPPALTSATWLRDLEEIRRMGARDSTVRTSEQTVTARFWFMTGAVTYNPIIRQVAAAKRLDLVDCARIHALASMAAADSFIAVFEAKYHFAFWRPVTAIRVTDPSWLPLGETPMHPEYPCAHCISAAAVAGVLTHLHGDDADIRVTSTTAPGVSHRWSTLSAWVDEVSDARVWAGFHYRFSTEVGRQMGRSIAEHTVATRLRPLVTAD
jgi:hypothetical protein